jgi:hypothetical protein
MCLHLYSTVCPVVCDHLRIDVTYIYEAPSPRARACNRESRGPSTLTSPSELAAARFCPDELPSWSALRTFTRTWYLLLLIKIPRSNASRSDHFPSAEAATVPVPGRERPGRGAGARTRQVAFSFLVTRQFA